MLVAVVGCNDAIAGAVGLDVDVPAKQRTGFRDWWYRQENAVDIHLVDALVDLLDVATELLTESQGHRVHEVGPPDLDHIGELISLF